MGYSDLIRSLDNIQADNNQQNQFNVPEQSLWSPAPPSDDSYSHLLKRDATATESALDFVGGALWGLVDTATFGVADWLGVDDLIMGGEFEDTWGRDTRYSVEEMEAMGGGMPTQAAMWGQTIGNIGAFMIPGDYGIGKGLKQVRIPFAPQAVTAKFIASPLGRKVGEAIPEAWFKGKVGVKGITPKKQALKRVEIAKKAGLTGDRAVQFNEHLSKGLFDKVNRAKWDAQIANPEKFVSSAQKFIDEAVAMKVKQGVLTPSQGKTVSDLWKKYYNKRPIQDFIDVLSTRFPGQTGYGLGSILHEALMFGSLDGISEIFHSMDEDRPYDWHRPAHGAGLGAAFGGLKLVLPKFGVHSKASPKGFFGKDALGRADFRAGMSAWWKPKKFFEGKSYDKLKAMSKWFGNDNRFGVGGKYKRDIKIDDVKGTFNFSRPNSEAMRWLEKLGLEDSLVNRQMILTKALQTEANVLGKEMMKAALSESWNSVSFVHAASGSAVMNWSLLGELYDKGWDDINKQDFVFNMVVGAWLNRHGVPKNKDYNSERMNRLRSGLDALGVDVKNLGRIIPSYKNNPGGDPLNPINYDAGFKKIAQKMDNMGMSTDKVENINRELPFNEVSAEFSKKDLGLFRQFYNFYEGGGKGFRFGKDLSKISEKDALEIQKDLKELGYETEWSLQDRAKDITERAEKEFEATIVDAAEDIFREDSRYKVQAEGSVIPENIIIDAKFLKRVEKNEFNHLFPEGSDPVEMAYSLHSKIVGIKNFIIGNQTLWNSKNVSKETFRIDESNFERLFNSMTRKENELNSVNRIRDDFRFRFDGMQGVANQINTSKVNRVLNDYRNKFNPNHPEWRELEQELVKAGLMKSEDGIDFKIVSDLSKLPIINEKNIGERTNGSSELQELQAIKSFVYQMLSAHGRNVYEPQKVKGKNYYPGISESQIRDLQVFLEGKGMPVDINVIDRVGHELIFNMLRDNIGQTSLTHSHLKTLSDFTIEIGKETDESNIFSMTQFNPIKTDKTNGWTVRILETAGLSKDNRVIAERWNTLAKEMVKSSETELAGNLVKIHEDPVLFTNENTFKVIDLKLNWADAMGSTSARKVLLDAVSAIEGIDPIKDVLGDLSMNADPTHMKWVSGLLSRMDILTRKKTGKNKYEWVFDAKRFKNKKLRRQLIESIKNYGIHFDEISQIMGRVRKVVGEQIGESLSSYKDHSGITIDGFFKKYTSENGMFNTGSKDALEARNNFVKNKLWIAPVKDQPQKMNPKVYDEVISELELTDVNKNIVDFSSLSPARQREIVSDVTSLISNYSETRTVDVYSLKNKRLEPTKKQDSSFKDPLTSFYDDLELNLKGFLDGMSHASEVVGGNYQPLFPVDLHISSADLNKLNPNKAHMDIMKDRVDLKNRMLKSMNMWEFKIGNSKQVALFNTSNYKEINNAFTDMYNRVLSEIVKDGKVVDGYEYHHRKLTSMFDKIKSSTEFDINLHTEALRTLVFERFFKGNQRNDFLKLLGQNKGEINKIVKRFNLVWTPSAKRGSRELLQVISNYYDVNNNSLTKTQKRVVDKYLSRKENEELNVAAVNDLIPSLDNKFSRGYSQRHTFNMQVEKMKKMWEQNGMKPPDFDSYSGGRKDVSTYDSVTFISKELAQLLSILSGQRGMKSVFKPIVSSSGENAYLYGKTVFVYDSNLNKFFGKKKNGELDMLMMGSADKLEGFKDMYTELTPEQILKGDKVDKMLSIPLSAVGIVKIPDHVTPSKFSITIPEHHMNNAEISKVYETYHRPAIQRAVEAINDIVGRPSFEAEALRLIKGLKEENLHELYNNGGSGEQVGMLIDYIAIAGDYARPSALGSNQMMNAFKSALLDQALSPYTQKSGEKRTNWGQKMVLSKSVKYEGGNALDATIISDKGEIMSIGEVVLSHAARRGDIEFKEDGKEIYLVRKTMVNGEFEQILARDLVNELVNIKLDKQIYEVKVDMFEHPTMKSTVTNKKGQVIKEDAADVWIVDNISEAKEQLKAIRAGAGKGKNFTKIKKVGPGEWILEHKFGDHKYIYDRTNSKHTGLIQSLIPDSFRTKGGVYRKTLWEGEGTTLWSKMAESAEPLGSLFDLLSEIKTFKRETMKDGKLVTEDISLKDFQAVIEFLRYPRTRPNDFTALRLKDFLPKDAGNQMILNPLDVWQIFEGDYDVDMGDAFWGTSREVLQHANRAASYNVTGINTENIEPISSPLEIAPMNLRDGKEKWDRYDSNVRILERAIGQVQNLTAPLNNMSNKAEVTPSGRKVLLRYPSELHGLNYEIEINFDAKDAKQHIAQMSQEILDQIKTYGYNQISRKVLFPEIAESYTADDIKRREVGFRGQSDPSKPVVGENQKFRIFVKRLVDGAGNIVLEKDLPGRDVKQGKKNDYELGEHDKIAIETYIKHYNKLQRVMPGRKLFTSEGSKSVTYQDLISSWESYSQQSRSLDNTMFKAIYYHKDQGGRYVFRENGLAEQMFSGLQDMEVKNKTDFDGKPLTYKWRQGTIVPTKVRENYENATYSENEIGSFAERALRDIHTKPLENYVLEGRELERYMIVEDLLLNGNEIETGHIDNVIAVLPQVIKDVYQGKRNIQRINRSIAKIQYSNRSEKAKKYYISKLNDQKTVWETQIHPLLTKEYKKNPTIKNLPDFDIVDIQSNQDMLEATAAAHVMHHLLNNVKPKAGFGRARSKIIAIKKKIKHEYKVHFNQAGLKDLGGKRLRDQELTEYLLNPKDIEMIENEIYRLMLDGYVEHGPGFLYEFARDVTIAKNGVGMYNNNPMPLYTKTPTSYKRVIKFLLKLRAGNIEGMQKTTLNDHQRKQIDKQIHQIARLDYSWNSFFRRRSFIEDIPGKDIKMFHMGRSLTPEFNYRTLSMFQKYTATPLMKSFDNNSPFGMGREWDKHMSWFRELLVNADIPAKDAEPTAKVLSYIMQLEIENMYMNPLQYLTLMDAIPKKVQPIVNLMFPSKVNSKNGTESALRNNMYANDVNALLGGGSEHGRDGITLNPGLANNTYSYKVIKRLLAQGMSIQKSNRDFSVERMFEDIEFKVNRKESEKTEEQKRRENLCIKK